MAKDEVTPTTTTRAATQDSPLDDKTIKQVERMIKQIDPNATIGAVIARQPFTQVPEGLRCITCGYVNQAETEACVMCETAGQIVLTIKRSESKDA